MNYPILIAPISRALEDPAIFTANNEAQLQKLILDPIFQTQIDLPKRLVIVIDALDECDDNILVNIVELLATSLETTHPSIRSRLRFLVTSRPEIPLVDFFERRCIPSFDMSTINPDDRERDIRIFLRDELQKLAKLTSYELREADIRLLAKISGGVFVAARIAIDFVASGESPDSQLQRLQNAGPISGLDVVYRLVIDSMAQEPDILGVVVLSFAPLSRQALIDLLDIGAERLDQLLAALRAVIHVREGDAVYPIHASLRDFLTDRKRCTNLRILVEPSRHHSIISCACLDFMARFLTKPELDDTCRDGKNLLPYACRYWARHLADSDLDGSLVDRLQGFASIRLLYWVECLSLLDDLELGINGLGILNEVLVGLCLHDCEHKLDI